MSGERLREAADRLDGGLLTLTDYDDNGIEICETELPVAAELADVLRTVACGLHCDKDGQREPYCSACSDSTYNHECPPSVKCEHTVSFRHALALADAILGGTR